MKKIRCLVLVIVPLLLGTCIYLVFRLNSLPLGTSFPHLPPFAIYSLPDGLWLFSLSNLLSCIWNAQTSIYALWWGAVVVASLATELLQYKGVIPGTGDEWDCVAYLLAASASYYIHFKQHKIKQYV